MSLGIDVFIFTSLLLTFILWKSFGVGGISMAEDTTAVVVVGVVVVVVVVVFVVAGGGGGGHGGAFVVSSGEEEVITASELSVPSSVAPVGLLVTPRSTGRTFSMISFLFRTFTGDTRKLMPRGIKVKRVRRRTSLDIGQGVSVLGYNSLGPFVHALSTRIMHRSVIDSMPL